MNATAMSASGQDSAGELQQQASLKSTQAYLATAHDALRDSLALMVADAPADAKLYLACLLLAKSGAALPPAAQAVLARHVPNETLSAVLASRPAYFDRHSAAYDPATATVAHVPTPAAGGGGALFVSHSAQNALVVDCEDAATSTSASGVCADKVSFVGREHHALTNA